MVPARTAAAYSLSRSRSNWGQFLDLTDCVAPAVALLRESQSGGPAAVLPHGFHTPAKSLHPVVLDPGHVP